MQRVKSEQVVSSRSKCSKDRSGFGSASASERQLERHNRPGSGRSDRERQLSGRLASSSHWSGDGSGALRRSSDGAKGSADWSRTGSADGAGPLMPIAQRSAFSPASIVSRRSVYQGSAAEQLDSSTEHSFKRRLNGDVTPGNTYRMPSRLTQLSNAMEQTESPKGLDRALTPSMLKVVKKNEVAAEGGMAPKFTSGTSIFQSSFSKQRHSTELEACYEDLTAAFSGGLTAAQALQPNSPGAESITATTEHYRQPTQGLQSIQSSIESSTKTAAVQDAGTNCSDAEAATSQEDHQSPTQDGEVLNTQRPSSAGPRQVIPNDHVQQMISRKSLAVSTSRQLQLGERSADNHSEVISVVTGSTVQGKLPKLVRCNITRFTRRSLLGISKSTLFEMYNMKGKMKLFAERESGRQLSFAIFTPADEKRLEASLVSSTFVGNQFLLIGTDPASPAAACDPDQDPVIMAVSFGRSPSGQRMVTALLPDHKVTSAGSNDLGSKQHISAYFARVQSGEAVKNVKVLQSVPGKELQGARFSAPSVKNVQLQLVTMSGHWPDFEGPRPRAAGHPAATPAQPKSKTVFEFGRLRHKHEFVCDYESPTLTNLQALGLAVACSAPKATFLYL